jgi:Nif-specific regulatory protein
MNPRLIAITGKLRGTAFALSDDAETSIGREAKNAVCLSDASVSRRHCVVNRTNDARFVVRDLDSFNGTFVNGAPVREKELVHGDQVAVGDVLMFFLLHETESESVFKPLVTDDNLNAQSTIRLTKEDAVYLHPEKLFAALPQMARVAKDLSALLKISKAISSLRELAALQKELLELIGEVVPAQRGAIILTDENREIVSSYGWDKKENGNVKASKTVVEQCLKEGVALLCNCISENKDLSEAESLMAAEAHSVLCVPLIAFKKTIGVIYLDTSDPNATFDQDHLQLLTGIAGVAAHPLENALYAEQLAQETKRLSEQLNQGYQMIGDSQRMQEVYRLIAKVAPADSTVLILGESGTGKELAARAIHQASNRKNNPFVAINCATLSKELLESELFGHEKGSFTGAIAQKKGKIEIASGGTLFFDEIGELDIALQAKLLRVLQEREFERVGGTKVLKANARVVAATNRNLEEAINDGKFRQDLYYRLNVVSFAIPPLRERREDITLLTQYFTSKYSERCKRKIKGLMPEARACLQNYNWPGNVRELENAIERAVVLSQTDLITLEDLPETVIEMAKPNEQFSLFPYQDAVNEAKRRIVTEAIELSDGNLTEAAKKLGIHPNNLHRLIRTLSLKDDMNK